MREEEEFALLIGGGVRRERLAAGLTQGAVSERSGIAVPHLSRLEAGRQSPTVWTLYRVAAAIGVPVCRLIDPPPDPGPPKRGRKSGTTREPGE